ncbi:MAG: prenyltransferase/squalene oxidase repeat-containing protein, partial [Pirellulales bacterium]
ALIPLVTLLAEPAIEVSFTENEEEIWAEELGKQVMEKTFNVDEESKVVEQKFSDSPLPEVEDPLAAPPELEITDPLVGASSDIKAPDVGAALTGRQRGRKGDLLAGYGGNRLTEEAVIAALEWLARQQRQDGSWSLRGPYANPGERENVVAATAMALLAFQGHGHTHLPPRDTSKKTVENERAVRYAKIVANGWAALGKYLDKDGNFIQDDISHARLYTQAQATIALCELWAMSEDPKYKEMAQRAVDYAAKIQDAQGGWRYDPGSDSDTSVSGWFMMALQSARMGKLNVPGETLKKLGAYLDSVALAGGAQYRYRKDGHTNPAMTAEGLLCRQYLGWPKADQRLRDGCDYLATRPMVWAKRDVYHWYYATQVMHHMEGVYWRDWNRVMCKMLPTNQVRKGKERGSWEPEGDTWGDVGGRLYVTCLSTYMLEVYYRHLPLYRKAPPQGSTAIE